LRVGLTASEINAVVFLNPETGLWAALHDIGKIQIPLAVLGKTEGFNGADMEVMRSHVKNGYNILVEESLSFSAWIALTHHRYQTHPYPKDSQMMAFPFPIPNASPETMLTANEIARMVSLADTYDAGHRPNNRFGGKTPSGSEIKARMLSDNPSRRELIEEIYNRSIFRG